MVSTNEAQTVIGSGGSVLSSDGKSLGKATRVYLDDDTGEPAWVSVSGLLQSSQSFVPLAGAGIDGDDITVRCTKDEASNAPDVTDHDGRLSPDDDAALHGYYDGTAGGGTSANRIVDSAPVAGDAVDSGELVMTRSEEQLRVHTQRVPVTRVRLRRVVVTENVTKTIPVSHEEFRLEEVPINEVDGDDVVSGAGLDGGYEMVLRAERIVVTKEVAAVERVRFSVQNVVSDRQISGEVRREQIVADETKPSGL